MAMGLREQLESTQYANLSFEERLAALAIIGVLVLDDFILTPPSIHRGQGLTRGDR